LKKTVIFEFGKLLIGFLRIKVVL
jgi:hypothetical protein